MSSTQRNLSISDPIFGDSNCDEKIYSVLIEKKFPPKLSRTTKLYYYLRPFIPLRLRQYLHSKTRPQNVNNDWFIDTELLFSYAALLGEGESKKIINFWPDQKKWGFVLTHDVETKDGFKNIERIVQLEEKYNFVSSWNLVPYKYPISFSYVMELKSRGFEIGIHGYNHDGKDYFSRRIFQKRAKYINEALVKYGAVGFRSSAVHRNLEWLQELDIIYDASCFDVDPFQPMPGGTKSIWPFVVGKFVEIPYTVPQDHVLFISLKERSNEIWKKKTIWLIEYHGLVCLITHPDYLTDNRLFSYYEDYLVFLKSRSDYWHGTPADLAEWWTKRVRSRIASNSRTDFVDGPAAGSGGILRITKENGRIAFYDY